MSTSDHPSAALSFLSRPRVGDVLTLVASLGILVLGMVLPLVGQAGAQTDHYAANRVSFRVVVFIALTLAALACWSKIQRSRADGSPFPRVSTGLVGLYVLVLLLEGAGLLAI